MSETIVFDTHRFVKRLTDAGLQPSIAEALAEEQAQLVENKLATKADLHELEARLQTAIVTAKFDLLKWIIMALVVQGGLVVAFVKLL